MSCDRGRAADRAGTRPRRPCDVMRARRRATARRTPACRRTPPGGARLPFAGARQLPNLADDEIALEAAKAIDEQRPVEVIHLVLKRPREQPRSLVRLLVPVAIAALDDSMRGPHDGRVEPRHAQAAFFFELNAIALDELRI